MGSLRMRGFVSTFALVIIGCSIGCTSTTRVTFNGPPGSVLYIDGKPYHLPSEVALTRPGGSAGSMKQDAELAFTLPQTSQEVRATGYIEVFGYTESEIDKVVVNRCNLDEANLMQIPGGKTVVFRGQSASRQPLYDLTLRQK